MVEMSTLLIRSWLYVLISMCLKTLRWMKDPGLYKIVLGRMKDKALQNVLSMCVGDFISSKYNKAFFLLPKEMILSLVT